MWAESLDVDEIFLVEREKSVWFAKCNICAYCLKSLAIVRAYVQNTQASS